MKKIIFINLLVLIIVNLSFAQITETLDPSIWSFGANTPVLATGTRGDGTTGAYNNFLVGTSI
jgi:hypothetical protein